MAMSDESNSTKKGHEAHETGEDLGLGLLTDGRSAFEESAQEEIAAESQAVQPAHLGTERYVHAAFFGAGLLIAFLASRIFTRLWNMLAEWPIALEHVPQLVVYDEEFRGNVGLAVGALVGLIAMLRLFRRPKIRGWADEVAGELAKVTWPDREAVTNGTIVVITASLIATVYVTVLDKFWSFATGLIYAP